MKYIFWIGVYPGINEEKIDYIYEIFCCEYKSITAHLPCQVSFHMSGTEAVMGAVKAARAATGGPTARAAGLVGGDI